MSSSESGENQGGGIKEAKFAYNMSAEQKALVIEYARRTGVSRSEFIVQSIDFMNLRRAARTVGARVVALHPDGVSGNNKLFSELLVGGEYSHAVPYNREALDKTVLMIASFEVMQTIMLGAAGEYPDSVDVRSEMQTWEQQSAPIGAVTAKSIAAYATRIDAEEAGWTVAIDGYNGCEDLMIKLDRHKGRN